MAIPEIVENLVARFARNRDLYCGSGYKETQLRREFLDPFFEALGWDVDNKRGASPLYQDVVHEYGTDVEGSQKTADYAFRVGEKVKFFAEAKKPGTRLKDDPTPALQLRRYAYSASLALSILTDFEEFAVYDGRVPPKKADAASHARVLYFTYDEYPERWEEIAAVFSRDAVWRGDFDKYAEKAIGGKHEPVDKAFLKLLERWRDELARNVANRNREKELDKYELSGAVQAVLDRVIFLRVAEDRGIEGRSRLEALMTGENVYGRLVELFLEADDVYNSGLFHFREEKRRATARDELTPTLRVDDAVLRKILRELAESPYEFGVVPVEILGQVYEQFLGKTIWLDGRGVHIDYKPEVRKAKGVYYTPQYIVEYIVKNTVGELLKGCKTPTEAAKLKILDPACGSGSFLLGAYQHLINWHLEWYVNDGPAKHEGRLVATAGPGPASWRLTAAAKKDILLNNIYGVDIDPQAVEVTKLSLLLKALEGESRESVGAQTKFLRERILPDLGDNIKCGNSLIGSDYFDVEVGQTLLSVPPDEEERRRVNPFDWEVEFEEIMKAGGFDAVIGNPPYQNMIVLDYIMPENGKNYLKSKFSTAVGGFDIYVPFIEKGEMLLKYNGLLGFIIPNKFLAAEYAIRFREWLGTKTVLLSFTDFSKIPVFESAVYPIILIIRKGLPEVKTSVSVFTVAKKHGLLEFEENRHRVRDMCSAPDFIWSFVLEKGGHILGRILKESIPLGNPNVAEITGSATVSEAGEYPVNIVNGISPRSQVKKAPLIITGNIDRYSCTWGLKPTTFAHVRYTEPFLILKPPVPERRVEQALSEKLMVAKVALRPEVYWDEGGFAGVFVSYIFKRGYDLKFLCGILNSKLSNWVYKMMFGALAMSKGYLRFQPPQLKRFPVPKLKTTSIAFKERHDRMVALVEEMLELHKRLSAAKADADKKMLQRAIDVTDKKIDALVYELYGLTDEEIRVVEG